MKRGMTHILAASTATLLLAAGPTLARPAPAQPDSPAALVKEGQKLNAAGKHDDALGLYRRALELKPDLAEAHLETGIALDLKGDYRTAREHLEKALALAQGPLRLQVLAAMGVSYAFEAKAAEASRYYRTLFDEQAAAQDFAGAAATANALGRVYLEGGDAENAYRWYQTGYETSRRQADLKMADIDLWEMRWQHALGRIAVRRRQLAQAREHAAAVKALIDKGGPNAEQMLIHQYLLGYIAFYGGDYQIAVTELQKADQRDPFILGLLAQALERTGSVAEARATYAKIVAVNAHTLQVAFSRPLAKSKFKK